MTNARVFVVGSINADDSIRLARMPGPGETVAANSLATSLGGKGANQAVAAARAGGEVRMIGAVGAVDGDPLVSELSAHHIDTSGVARLSGVPSGRAVVLVDDEGENSIVVVPGANRGIPSDVVREFCATLHAGDVLLLQNEIPAATSRQAAALARAAGATVIWNAAPAPFSRDELVDGIDMLVVNEHELRAVSALLGLAPHDDRAAELRAVAAEFHCDMVCTLGAAGATYLVAGRAGTAAALRVEAVDTTAAGDTFVGYLAATTGLVFEERLQHALAAGSLAVTRAGAAASIPPRAEVEQLLESARNTETRLV